MDPQPHQQFGPEKKARRRSSIAYDPARDTFTEISDVVREEVVSNESHNKTSDPVQTKSNTMSSSPETRKRQHSASPANSAARNGLERAEPPQKRQRSIERDTPENGTATARPNHESQKPVSRIPRIPKVAREDGEVGNKPARTPAAFSNRRPDTNQESRRRHDDEKPRDYERVRDRPKRRSRSPERRVPSAYRRRSPPRPTKRDPSPIRRSPSPIRDSPPRNVPRPGGGRGRGRNVLAEQERLRAEREKAQGIAAVNNGVQGVVNEWYNAVPEYVKERGRDWRRNESQIKGLRSFNNWVKSCIIQKFSPQEKHVEQEEELGWGETAKEPEEIKPLLVLDMGCGKGGDLGKWEKAPQAVGLYTGLDPADQSIEQARDRYRTMWRGRRPRFDARFAVKDCFGEWIGEVPIVQEVGIDPTPNTMNRWGKGGGFDIVTMMFSMHYSFESQAKVEMMLRNVSGALKKGGRFIGVCPNSDVLSDRVKSWFRENGDKYKAANGNSTPIPETNGETNTNGTTAHAGDYAEASAPSWGNSIYSVRFPPASSSLPPIAPDGSFRPAFGHKYTYYIAEAVDVPEFVVPWEAFRSIAEHYGLEQRYRKGFLDIWNCETDPQRATNTGGGAAGANTGGWGQEPADDGQDSTAAVARELEQLGVRMGVIKHPGGPLCMTEEEKEAVAFYHGFCFVKT
ncbi:mRNA cap guanine-N7 methyltransferase [Knufia obscura]|uniref:mRNA cap guanine-N(7) methyltransferase n=2 Tax=Knufia TaxID=430999 RepID=A0AAN8F593_9EURO|nr:mRNA cap guanine-N7 methyltransferase [Knufia obscura]KAK5956923.1 mRNA cap guanine-N7 methyltransferase [Knufia fluminis]